MKTTIQVRLKENNLSNLNQIREKLKLTNNSDCIRACIKMTYKLLFEKEEHYFIDFVNPEKSLLLKLMRKKK